MFGVGEEFTFGRVEVHVGAVYLDVTGSEGTATTLDTNLDIVVLKRHEGKRLGPIITEEERENVMVGEVRGTECILGNLVESHGTRSLRLCVLVQKVVNTLNVEGINLGNLLTTDPKLELGSGGFILIEETRVRVTDTTDIFGLDPHVAQKITFRLDRNGDLITTGKSTDVIETFGLDREIGVALVVLTEKAHFGLTGDVYILGTDRDEVN